MAVNLCAAHKKADSLAAHKVLATCVLHTIVQHTKMDLVQRTKYSSCALHESLLSCHMRVWIESLDKNRTHTCSSHASVNLYVSCTIFNSYFKIINEYGLNNNPVITTCVFTISVSSLFHGKRSLADEF